ncbi:MAG: class I SAM-dependent RNA methyltransferase [Mycobacteriales bacterium]
MTSESWVGRELELEIGPVAHGGHCVSRLDGRVVFVRHALPGERVQATVTEDKGGSFCRADAVHVLTASSQRVTPPCQYAVPGGCGGCDWQHASPELQRDLKARVAAEQLSRLAGIEREVEVESIPGESLGWRNRIRMVAGRDGKAGFRAHRSHTVIPVAACLITAKGALDDVLARRWRPGAEIEVTKDAEDQVHVRELNMVHGKRRARQLQGGRAVQHAAGRNWQVDAHGFWQGHSAAADVLAGVVRDWARASPGVTAWDLYSGVGLFASVLAEQVGPEGSVVAIESNRQAVADGESNLADLPQVRWLATSVEKGMSGGSVGAPPEVVVLDPPRKGAGRSVVEAIAGRHPRRVVYVACDPAALARDTATFAELGYGLRELRAFDAFPMTHHLECVALLTP